MIQVTDDMLSLFRAYQMGAYGGLNDECMIAVLIELHEANKPKPEPVGYIYPNSYAKALRSESSCEMFVVPVTNLDTGEESSILLYTTPPTREPLSDDEKSNLVMEYLGVKSLLGKDMSVLEAFELGISAAEQAHGIGVKPPEFLTACPILPPLL